MISSNSVPCSSDGSKVALGDPSIPVVLQNTQRRAVILILTERPFVNDGIVSSVVENARSNPRLAVSTSLGRTFIVLLRTHLKQEPPTEVDTADFLGSIRKAGREGEHTLCEG